MKVNRKKQPSRALLPVDRKPILQAPALAPHPDNEAWHTQALFFWQAVWSSPMASQYTEADIPGLFRMALLTHRFMKTGSIQASAELRHLSSNYGLSPMDRRRLEWTIAKTEDAVDETEARRERRAKRVVNGDPRDVLA